MSFYLDFNEHIDRRKDWVVPPKMSKERQETLVGKKKEQLEKRVDTGKKCKFNWDRLCDDYLAKVILAQYEMITKLRTQFPKLSEVECKEFLSKLGTIDVVNIEAVYVNYTEAAKELGILTPQNEKYLDMEKFVADFLHSPENVVLSTGKIVQVRLAKEFI